MSFSIKQFITGIGLKPVSADPSNPTQGQLQYADGTVRAEGLWRYDGTAWQQVGSGAGSYDIFFQENLETNTSSNFTSGQNASPDAAGTGTLDGTLADEESSQISGDRSLKYTMGASSDNDFFLNDTDIALAVKQRGNFIGINFYYTYNGDDDDIRFFVLDQDDNELTQSDEYIKAASTATRFSTAVFVPSDDTGLRYGFQVVTGNSSKVFIVDDIEFSTNPFVYKELDVGTDWSDAETITVDATTTAPTKGSTTVDAVRYRRVGTNAEITYELEMGAGAAGSGDYLFKLPSGLTMDTSIFSATNGNANDIRGTVVGHGSWANTTSENSTTTHILVATVYDSQHVRLMRRASSYNTFGYLSNNYSPFTGSTNNIYFKISVPILGWTASAEHVVTPAKAVHESAQYVDVTSGSAFGSVNTKIPYFTTAAVNNTGELISIENSSSNGFSVTALKDCVVTASWYLQGLGSAKTVWVGWSLNSSQRTTSIQSITSADRLAINAPHDDGANSGFVGQSTVSVKLSAGDVLRPHGDGNTAASTLGGLVLTAQAANAEFLAAVPMNYTQTKVLSSSSTATGVISDLTFNNLVVGKVYSIDAVFSFTKTTGLSNSTDATIAVSNGATSLGQIRRNFNPIQDTVANHSFSRTFVATDTTVTFNATTMTRIQYNATVTHATLTELNYTKETTRFE